MLHRNREAGSWRNRAPAMMGLCIGFFTKTIFKGQGKQASRTRDDRGTKVTAAKSEPPSLSIDGITGP